MIYEGTQLSSLQIGCPECGQTTPNSLLPQSAFIRISCRNQECDMYGISVTIEKRCPDMIFSVGHHYVVDGKPAFPAILVDKDGMIVRPKQGRMHG